MGRRIPDCLYYTTGTIAPGGACGWTIECADGICSNENSCLGRVDVGESCQGVPCRQELACIVDTSGVPTVCVEPAADGPATFCNGV